MGTPHTHEDIHLPSEARKKEKGNMPDTKWLPLESNPDVLNAFVSKIGVDPMQSHFRDILGFDEQLLAMMGPADATVEAVLLLFPLTPNNEAHALEEKTRTQAVSDKVYYTKQTIGNACGTIAVLHALANAPYNYAQGSALDDFFRKTRGLSPADKAVALEDFASAHAEAGQAGQTAAPSADEEVNLHFICFTIVDGCLYELDGRKETPINHGCAAEGTCLTSSLRVIKEFIARDPAEIRFNAIALCNGPKQDDAF